MVEGGLMQFVGDRVSYRQLDRWCRNGTIRLQDDAAGSGSRRRVTDAEAFGIQAVIDRWDHIKELHDQLVSGGVFRQAVAQFERDHDGSDT